ncbi:MAG: alpha,alpha-phosphotrehalase [Coprobacillus sp.]
MDFQDKVVYQIYPKSFHDANGDGLGDLKGITQKLDYLSLLGIDYIWISPFFVSPQNDNGYDVADYRKIDPRYGTMEDLEELIEEAKKRNIYLMFDMVFNHTSIYHEWFQKALKGDRKYKDYYFFKKPVEGQMPTNWVSKFGGPVWEYVKDFNEYYLHLFDKTQADLNWENEDVRNELADIANFWLDKGVKGFRLDVINLIDKTAFENDYEGIGKRFYTDGDKVHTYLHELNEKTFGRMKDAITVGEMSATTINHCVRYTNPQNKELHMAFNFHHLKVDYKDKEKWTLMDFDFSELKELFHTWQVGMQEGKGWNALFYNCHDQPRSLSRFGNDKQYHKESAKMLATSIHMQRGTPYIYQGEEIGMTNAYYTDINQYKDVETTNYYYILKEQGLSEEEIHAILQSKSRDNSRTPVQWDDSDYAGFSKVEPWIEVIYNYKDINVKKSLEDKDSIFYYYQKLIKLRKEYKVISEGIYTPLIEDHKQVYAFSRDYKDESLIVVNNFYGKECEINIDNLDKYDILLSNYDDSQAKGKIILRPYESIVFYKNS